MKQKVASYLLLAPIIILLLLIGFYREFIFTSINSVMLNILKSKDFNHSGFHANLLAFIYFILYFIKWALTFLFTFIYFFFACLSIFIVYRNTKYVMICGCFFIAVFLLAFIFMGMGYVFHKYDLFYLFARKLMGLAQSPALLMILIPAFKLLKDENYVQYGR
jgi:hypothetical protein